MDDNFLSRDDLKRLQRSVTQPKLDASSSGSTSHGRSRPAKLPPKRAEYGTLPLRKDNATSNIAQGLNLVTDQTYIHRGREEVHRGRSTDARVDRGVSSSATSPPHRSGSSVRTPLLPRGHRSTHQAALSQVTDHDPDYSREPPMVASSQTVFRGPQASLGLQKSPHMSPKLRRKSSSSSDSTIKPDPSQGLYPASTRPRRSSDASITTVIHWPSAPSDPASSAWQTILRSATRCCFPNENNSA